MAGLYVHVPFRRAPRPHDEGHTVAFSSADLSAYETAVCRELTYYACEYAAEEPVTTVYVGGGRPSLLPLHTIQSILTTVVDVFDASGFEEATTELNPADASPGYLRDLKHMGFDRLSIGVMSFFPEDLRATDAPHTADDAVRAIQLARETGFQNLSVDLLFGWAGQPMANWKAVLRQAVQMNLPHVTIMEVPATSAEEREGALAERLEFAITFLQSEGYEQYELTHFARPAHRSVHQETYYAHGNHLGIGPSAESFWWTDRASSPVARRWANVGNVEKYVQLLRQRYPPVAYRQTLEQTALAYEYILLRLRTNEGINLPLLDHQYGYDLEAQKSAELDRLQENGLIHREDRQVRLTNRGRLLADAVTKQLLPST